VLAKAPAQQLGLLLMSQTAIEQEVVDKEVVATHALQAIAGSGGLEHPRLVCARLVYPLHRTTIT
jgi:hypothetical protein